MTVLTSHYSKDTKQREVMDWVIPYGKGRVYTTMLGHLWKDGPDTAMRCVGFRTMFVRGVEWAAPARLLFRCPPTSRPNRRSGCEPPGPTAP